MSDDFMSKAHAFLETSDMAQAESLFEEAESLGTEDELTIWIKAEDLELTEDGLCTPRQIKALEALCTFKDNGQVDLTKPHPSTLGKGIQNFEMWCKFHKEEEPF